jgi:hypothetical protein
MNEGKYVFAQIASFLPQRTFDSIVYPIHACHRPRPDKGDLAGQFSNRFVADLKRLANLAT